MGASVAQRDHAVERPVRKDQEQRRLVLAVDDRERSNPSDTRSIHRGNRCIAYEVDERALLGARKQMVAPQLEVLTRLDLASCVEMRERRKGRNGGSSDKFTSVHEYPGER